MAGEIVSFDQREILTLISFTNDAVITAHSSFPHELPQSQVQELVKIFLASLSVSEALLGSSGNGTQNITCNSSDGGDVARKATNVLLDTNTQLIAIPAPTIENGWLGILAHPLSLNDRDILDELIPTLVEAADALVLKSSQPEAKVFNLLKDMWILTRSNFWSTDKRVVHIKKALILRAESSVYVPEGHLEREHSQSLEWREYVHSTLCSFRSALAEISGEMDCACSVISPSMKLVYFDGLTQQAADAILWYYSTILGVGSRASHRYIFESVDENRDLHKVRLWYKWRNWVLCTYFRSEKAPIEQEYKATRSNAIQLLHVFSEKKSV